MTEDSRPPEKIEFPPQLLMIAKTTVATYRERGGTRPHLDFERLLHEEFVLEAVDEIGNVKSVGIFMSRVFKAFHFVPLLVLAAAWIWGSKFLWLLIPCALVLWYTGRMMRRATVTTAVYLLALDFVTNNLAGWGDALPYNKACILRLRGETEDAPSHQWLDQYIPNFATLPTDILESMRPS